MSILIPSSNICLYLHFKLSKYFHKNTLVQGGEEPTDAFKIYDHLKCVSRLRATLYNRKFIDLWQQHMNRISHGVYTSE